MRRVKVDAPGGAYTVSIGAGAAPACLPDAVARLRPSRLHLVSDERVAGHHGEYIKSILGEVGCPLSSSVVPAGESSKSSRQLERLWRDMVRQGCDRQSCVVALGGGVVGDLAGFAAATFLRGVGFVQVPTTLLAMVDASVGGKTGINLSQGKNLVGAFHQPKGVVADLDLLRTLSGGERTAGWAEVIKTAAIRDARLFRRLEREQSALCAAESAALEGVIARCVRIKADVVGEDERESGLRRILNFGHTLAHALEAVQAYGGLLHGEAVAVGMVFAARLGTALGYTAAGVEERLEVVLHAYGLPTRVDVPSVPPVLRAMERDKKRGKSGICWVFVPRIGETRIEDGVDRGLLRRELRSFLAAR